MIYFMEKEILSCVGTDHEVHIGDIIMPQQVACVLQISPMQATELLNDLAERGFLKFEDCNNGKIAGWHFTQLGVETLL